MERVFGVVERVLHPVRAGAGLLAAGGVALLIGWLLRLRGSERARGVWVRGLSGVVLASIGFFSMSMEVLLVMVFQGLYGYIYTRMGVIVAAFMLGLVIGAPTGRALCRRGAVWGWGSLFVVLGAQLLGALSVPRIMLLAFRWMGHPVLGAGLEVSFYLMVAWLGFLTGAAFPPANLIFTEAGGSLGTASAVTDASDHLGAALGALLIGVVLLPVLGVDGACALLAVLMAAGLMALTAAAVARQEPG
jgi:spermidine synthase